MGDQTRPLTHGSLFTGIGGFDLGFEWAGFATAWQVEISPYCIGVLKRRFPGVPRHADITECGAYNLAPVDVLTGGFPCQPFSLAGKRRGATDDRYLWPEMRRIVAALRPAWVVAENVPGIIGVCLDDIMADLEAEDYEAGTIVLPACAFGAWHRRDRVFMVANAAREPRRTRGSGRPQAGQEAGVGGAVLADADSVGRHWGTGPLGPGRRQEPADGRSVVSNADSHEFESRARPYRRSAATELPQDADVRAVQPRRIRRRAAQASGRKWWAAEPRVGRVAYGVPHRLDRLAALGNAVVPQAAYWIACRIREAIERHGRTTAT